jgi:hypothetical protein
MQGCRELHNEEVHNLYSPPNIIRIIKSRRMRWARHVTRMRRKRNVFMGNPEGKRPLRRLKRKSEDNIKMYVRQTGWGGMDLINLA